MLTEGQKNFYKVKLMKVLFYICCVTTGDEDEKITTVACWVR